MILKDYGNSGIGDALRYKGTNPKRRVINNINNYDNNVLNLGNRTPIDRDHSPVSGRKTNDMFRSCSNFYTPNEGRSASVPPQVSSFSWTINFRETHLSLRLQEWFNTIRANQEINH
jgi:hypothetical protein